MKRRKIISIFVFLIILIGFGFSQSNNVIKADEWLVLGPVDNHLPVFFKDKQKAVDYLLDNFRINLLNKYPQKNIHQFTIGKKDYKWEKINGKLNFKRAANYKTAYVVLYLETNHFINGELKISSHYPYQVFFDNEKIMNNDRKPNSIRITTKKEISVFNDKHIIFIKTLFEPGHVFEWDIEAEFKPLADYKDMQIKLSASPERRISLREILDIEKANRVRISPDGSKFLIFLEKRLNEEENKRWIELRSTVDGRIIESYEGFSGMSNVKWRPDGKAFSFVKREKDESGIVEVNLSGEHKIILDNVKNFGNYQWSPGSDFIIYTKTKKVDEYKKGIKRLLSTEDRQKGHRDKSYLYIVYPDASGYTERLTEGHNTTYLQDIRKDGKKILFSTNEIDYKKRPYSVNNYYIQDLETKKTKKVFSSYFTSWVKWLNNTKLLVAGGPSAFDKIGSNIPDNKIPNDYDTQVFIYNLLDNSVKPITKNFKPSINYAVMNSKMEKVYFVTTDKSYANLYEYDLLKKSFQKINTGNEVINSFSMSENEPKAVFIGNSSNIPPKVYFIDLKTGEFKQLYFPGKEDFQQIKFGEVKDWSFKNEDGYEIIGRIYYPPGFDSSKKYPAIIYYYGGTSPVERSFGGRYPKNFWASQGYVIYVLQPRGAVGFGQEFSSFHVNDWGRKAGDDILTGAEKFIKSFSFIDGSKIGIIGASYGGFMTEYLVSKTDKFAAAISHAGISLLPHYWGEGYWGYTYSAVATAESFPWNRKDIYVDLSPLFRADKINTPLLLLHGAEDTNVPTGESDQLYTALKLLGRPVEYIKVKGQNHWIMDYKKRKIWSATIVAWFDNWLKDKNGLWNFIY